MSSISNKRTTIDEDNSKSNILINFENVNKDLNEFVNPFVVGESYNGNGLQPKTLVELTMMQLSASIRSKDRWFDKIQDQSIVNKWKQEALQNNQLTQKQIDYVFDQLKYYDAIRDGSIEMSTVDSVWQSDQLINSDLRQSLIDSIESLENIPEKDKDWHPNTNNQVLDLVHPSLFPYINQITKVINKSNEFISLDQCLQSIGQGETIDLFNNENLTKKINSNENVYYQSKIYQWLPSQFNISKDGKVKIESYINNLHPIKYKKLYFIIEQIFECFIPLFNKLLNDLISIETKPNEISVDPFNWYDNSNQPEYSSDNQDFDQIYEEYLNNRILTIPDVETFQMPFVNQQTKINLNGRQLQVIVKLANIILTPSNPNYSGGIWHVEGMKNEHIVATGIYYYFNSNLTQSNLQFRTNVKEPDYEQNDDRGVRTVYGLTNESPLNQYLGQVTTNQHRCLVFPNIYQHRISSFQLKDKNQIGQRKILVFFLVDPSIKILSTINVPPQQLHWFNDILCSIFPFNQLPQLIIDKIVSYIDFKQAKFHREKLMFERKVFIQENTQLVFERPFSLCEH